MSDYNKATNFTAKDSLTTGDPSKIVLGSEIDTELTAIETAIATKADEDSPTFTGTVTVPTASGGSNTTVAASTAFVRDILPAGVIVPYGGSSAPSNWLLCNGQAVSRATYATLFAIISTTYGTGDGSTTFNVPDLVGRVPIGSGTGTLAENVGAADVSAANGTFTVVSNTATWITGMAVVLTTTGTLPAGLSLATTYYVVRDSATTIKFASSLANAVAGTVINITDIGSGTHTVTHTLTARTLGQKLGQETHANKATELPVTAYADTGHTHAQQTGSGTGTGETLSRVKYNPSGNAGVSTTHFWSTSAGASSSFIVDIPTISGQASLTNAGGSTDHNIMQASLVLNYIIKT